MKKYRFFYHYHKQNNRQPYAVMQGFCEYVVTYKDEQGEQSIGICNSKP